MSIKLMSAVWDMDGISSTQKLVLLALADWSNDEGLSWPSIERIARKASLTERSVQKTIRSLEECGLVSRDEVLGKGNRYWIAIPLNDVHPRTTFTPPLNHVHPTPEPRSPNTSMIHHRNTIEVEGAADWLPLDAWNDWLAMRKRIKKPLTERAMVRAIKKLSDLRDAGQDPEKVLDQSVTHCWIDLYAVKENTNGAKTGFNSTIGSKSSGDGIGDALNRRLGLG